jgi:hypothetical protein
VNPASAGKTVFHILGGAPSKEDFAPYSYQYQQNDDTVVFQLLNSGKGVSLQKSELLWLPLDIPPNQSETKWYPARIYKAVGEEEKHLEVRIRLKAQDVLGNDLAEIDQTIELKTHQIF